jgi:amino acid transporter
MIDQSELTAPSTPAGNHPGGGLQRNAVTWRKVAILSVAGAGPAASSALNLQFMSATAGAALVLAFVLAWPGILILGHSFAEFSRRIASAGGIYTWNAQTWGSHFGFVYGWITIGAYLVLTGAGFVIFGGWMHDWLQSQFSVNVPWILFTAAGMVLVTVLAVRGITQTLEATLALLGLEVVLLLALGIWMLIDGGPSGLSTLPFKPSSASGGFSAIGLAMTFAVLSHIGIEEGATLGEETQQANRALPKGLLAAAVAVPLFYIFLSYAMVTGYGVHRMGAFANDTAPLQTLAKHFWGSFGLAVISLATGSSILAFTQSAFVACNRVIYTLGREGMLPRACGRISKRHTPVTAIFITLALALALGVPLGFDVGPFKVWGDYGLLISIGFLILYLFTNLALAKFAWQQGEFSWLRHGLLGLIGAVLFVYPLYRTVIPLPSGVLGAMPFIFLGWVAIGGALLLHARARRPHIIPRVGSYLALADAEGESQVAMAPVEPAIMS